MSASFLLSSCSHLLTSSTPATKNSISHHLLSPPLVTRYLFHFYSTRNHNRNSNGAPTVAELTAAARRKEKDQRQNNLQAATKKAKLFRKLHLSQDELGSKLSMEELGALQRPNLDIGAKQLSQQRRHLIRKYMNQYMGVDQLGNSTKFGRREKSKITATVLKKERHKFKWEHTDKKKSTRFANELYRRTFDQRKRKNIGVNSRFRSIKPNAKKLQKVRQIMAGDRVGTSKSNIVERNMLKKWDNKMRLVFGRKHFKFIAAASVEDSIPTWTRKTALPEFAFIGRSNVGKSSLLNTIGLSKQARVDARPGKTQTINFYNLNDFLMLVDLPGYGFAYSYEKDEWYKLTTKYLAKRNLLKRVFVLVDARHGIKTSDREIMEHLDKNGRTFQVILTKNDLVSQEDLARRMELVEKEVNFFRHAIGNVLLVSSRTQSGVHDLRRVLLGFVKQFKSGR